MPSLFALIPERYRRPSIRARISTLLLLSTLNTVAITSATFVLFNAIADSPTQTRLEVVHGARARVDGLEARLLDAALRGAPLDPVETATGITSVRDDLAASEIWSDELAAEWDDWEREARTIAGTPGLNPTRSDQSIGRLRLAHGRLIGRLLLAADYTRPEWVDRISPLLPWSVLWVGIVGVATVAMAWSLDLLLSKPLGGLALAADRVGSGDLSQAIEVRPSVPEVERVARAIAGMRDRLVRMIADVESRNQEMETILANLSDGVVLVDRTGLILEINRAAQRILAPPGHSRIVDSRLVTATDNPPTEGDPAERWLPELRTATGASTELEVIREHGGTKRWIEVSLNRVPLGRVIVLRDVTQDRELETLKRDFLSVITHELKTPLTPIEGYARLLQLGKGGPLNEKQLEFVGIIHTQAGILKTMVQNLLDATRIEGGQLPIHPQPFEVSGFLQQIGTTWRGNSETRGIRFTLENALPAGTLVQADPFRMEQVLGNLLSNAAKFTPSGGSITLRGAVEQGVVRVTVADTGRGIPASAVPRVFEKFYQVERGDTRAAGGAGLGLYIVRQLVEAMGGTVSVESEEQKGSRFWIELPVLRETA